VHNGKASLVILLIIALAEPVVTEGERFASTTVAGSTVRVTLLMRPGKPCTNPRSWIWGADQDCPDEVVAVVAVKWDNRDVFVPASAYSDLAVIQDLRIESKEPNRALVTIRGGDAGTAYTATLLFVNDRPKARVRLLERAVRSGEFPEETWEQTSYHFE
jgi:hypothetical protein